MITFYVDQFFRARQMGSANFELFTARQCFQVGKK